MKYNAQGIRQWDHRFAGELYARATSVWPTADGGYLLGCYTYTSGQTTSGTRDQSQPGWGYEDYWAIKLDAQGRKQWDRRFGSNNSDVLQKAWQTADGGYLLAGYSRAGAPSGDKTEPARGPVDSDDFWVVKLNAQGQKLWDRTLGGSGDEFMQTGIPTADGGCLLAGNTSSSQNGDVTEPSVGPSAGDADYWTIKLDAQGTKQWDHRYGGNGNETARALYQNPDGTYLVAGESDSGVSGVRTEPSRGGTDCWLLKLTAQGAKIWDHRIGTADDESPCTHILPMANGGYMLLASTQGGLGGDKTTPRKSPLDLWLFSLSATGTKTSEYTYSAGGGDQAASLLRLANGNLVALSSSGNYNNPTFAPTGDRTVPVSNLVYDGWSVRLDPAGTKLGDTGNQAYPDESQSAVLRTRDGGLLALGFGQNERGLDKTSAPNYGGLPSFWLLKRDSLGVARWDTVVFDYSFGQYKPKMQELPNGQLLISGTASLRDPYEQLRPGGGPGIDKELLATQLTEQGGALWRQQWGGPGDDWLAELRPTADNGYALGATSRSGIGRDKSEASRGGADFWLLKLNTARARQWDHRYGGSGLDSLMTMRQTPDGGFLLAGSTTSPVGGDLTEPGRGGADYWLVKTNAGGGVQWQHRYGGPADDWLAQARPTPDGGCLLLGTTASGVGGELTEAPFGRRDLWVVKVNSLGIVQWQHRYGGPGNEYAAALEPDPDGGYIVGASTTSPGGGPGTVSPPSRGGTDYWLLRLSAQGTVLWDQRLGGSGEDVLTCLSTTRGYGYALGGQSNSPTGSGEHQQPNKGGYDYWTLLLGARRVPAPVIASFTPGSGVSGTVVVLTGTGFTGTSSVSFNGTPAPGFVVSNGGTTITVAVPFGAGTGVVAVTANGTGSSATPFVVTLPDLLVNAVQNVQGAYHNVRVSGPATGGAGVGTLTGPLAVAGTLLIEDGGTLRTNCQPLTGAGSFALAAGGTLGICDAAGIRSSGLAGAVQVAGARSFSADANYLYNGPAAQTTGSGLPPQVRTLEVDNATGLTLTQAVAVAQVLRLTRGDLATGGQGLTLLSSAAGTALVDNTGGVVRGTATVQRFVSPAVYAGRGYRHFSAPVTTATVGSLATAGFAPVLNAAGFNNVAAPGLAVPFPTVFGYDERRLPASPALSYSAFDRGWFSPVAPTDALTLGRGYTVYLSAGETVQFTGPLHNGPLSVPLTRSTGPAVAAETGWHLVGNPYPSPLDWRLLTRPAGLDDACYVFQPTAPYAGSYRAYVNGFGPAPLIGSGMGFFVRVNAAGATPALAFANAARLTVFGTEPALARPAADPRPHLTLTVQNAAGTAPPDETTVYFEAGATPGPDARYDARKLPNPTGLNLASAGASVGPGADAYAINGLPPLTAQPLAVPLALAVPQAGAYAFTATALGHFAPGSVWLHDAAGAAPLALAPGTRYAFAAGAAPAAGRFWLEFRPGGALASAAAALAAQVQVYPNPATGRFTLALPARAGAGSATLLNALGQVVRTVALPPALPEVPVYGRGLPPGVYQLRVLLGTGLPPVVRRVVLE